MRARNLNKILFPVSRPESPTFSLWLFALLSFLAFSPCLVLGRAYFDNDLLAQFGPWRAFLKNQLSQGHFPLWNPYSLGGQPFFADLQNMMLYPFNYLTLPFSVPYGLGVFFFLHMFWSAAGMRWWLRALGLSENACRVGALLFAFSNFFWLELIHPPVLAAFSWLPWLFGALEKLSRKPKPARAFGAGLILAMLFLCGSFQVTVGAFYGGAAYFLFRYLHHRKNHPPFTFRTFSLLTLFLLWGALPLLGQFIPTLEFSALTNRRVPNQTYEQFNAGLSLSPKTLYQFIFPRFSLEPGQEMAKAIQFTSSSEDKNTEGPFVGIMGYVGIWIPFLGLGAFRKKEKKIQPFLLFFCLAALAVCFGKYLPLYRFLCAVFPGFSLIRVPYRFIFLYVLGVSVLAAFGFEEWIASLERSKNLTGWAKAALTYAFFLYLVSLFRPAQNWREMVALMLGFAGMAVSTLLPSCKKWGAWAFQAALTFPLLLNGWADFVPGPASNFDFEKNSTPLMEIGKKINPYRLMFDNSHMGYPIQEGGKKYILNYPQNAACALGIKNAGGYNPLILQAKKDLEPLPMEPFLRVNAVKGMVTQVDHDSIPGFRLESFPPFLLYEYQKSVSYVYAPSEIQVVPDAKKRLEIMLRPDFDVSRTILFAESPPLDASQVRPVKPVVLRYELQKDGVDGQKFFIVLNQDNWVVIPETNFPGWKAWVDGQPAPILTADHLLRAVYLTTGQHQVEFRFQPDWLKPLQFGLLLWLIITLVFWIFGSRFPWSSKLA